ncbi:MAG TPA: hypothetical protein PK445_10120 [Methanolinea sp.]|nr:hypothetical protein [Methanolinea sp.]
MIKPVFGIGIAIVAGLVAGLIAAGLMKIWIRHNGTDGSGHLTREERAAKVVSKYMARR